MYVRWRDAAQEHNAVDVEDFDPDFIVETTGFVARKGKKHLSLAQDILPDGRFREICHIPYRYIIKKRSFMVKE